MILSYYRNLAALLLLCLASHGYGGQYVAFPDKAACEQAISANYLKIHELVETLFQQKLDQRSWGEVRIPVIGDWPELNEYYFYTVGRNQVLTYNKRYENDLPFHIGNVPPVSVLPKFYKVYFYRDVSGFDLKVIAPPESGKPILPLAKGIDYKKSMTYCRTYKCWYEAPEEEPENPEEPQVEILPVWEPLLEPQAPTLGNEQSPGVYMCALGCFGSSS